MRLAQDSLLTLLHFNTKHSEINDWIQKIEAEL